MADAFEQWLRQQRQMVPEGSAAIKVIDYSLKRRSALTRYIDDGGLPPDNIWVEKQIRPITLGRSNWLFAVSLRAGKRATAVVSLLHSERLHRASRRGRDRTMQPAVVATAMTRL